ncbi:hypothetical protein ATANTOWER_013142 [Ataeniobius toweri]|uniref:Uncharacterized protein n=1 Tax=Ataeniobius toweri TaxID=208326 RepID=A0ABU7A6G0_9TELE|nr:hypothetical protein [Ataeniobius toweri]
MLTVCPSLSSSMLQELKCMSRGLGENSYGPGGVHWKIQKLRNMSATDAISLLRNNKAVKVSIVKSEETKVRQEDLSKLLYEVQLLRTQQDNMECQIQDMKQQNEVLWREVVSLRQNHTQQQKVMNKLIQFLFSQMQSSTPSAVGLKRKL